MQLWFWPFVATLGVGLFLSVAVAVGRGDRAARLWLVVLLLAMSDFLAEFVAQLTGLYRPPIVFVTYPVFFLLGPAFWLLTRAMTGTPVSARGVLPHLIPVFLILVDGFPYYADLLRGQGYPPRTLLGMGGCTQMIVQMGPMGFYVLAGIRHLRRIEAAAPHLHSGDYVVRVRWIRRLALALVGVILTMITATLLMTWTGRYVVASEYAMALSLALVTLTLGWMIVREPQILAVPPSVPGKYERSSLAEDRLDEFAQKLLAAMDTRRPWLTPELRLADLAEAVGLSRHHLSQVLGQRFGESFYDFVNGYRVREAARQLLDEQERTKTILAVAYDSGFSSKASFNRVFKDALGVTPSRFRDHGSPDHPAQRGVLSGDRSGA